MLLSDMFGEIRCVDVATANVANLSEKNKRDESPANGSFIGAT